MATTADKVSTLARKFKVQVLAGSADPEAAEWIDLRGIQELTPGKEDNLEDDSDYDSDGWTSQVRTGQSWSLEVKALRKMSADKAYDPGQEIVRTASDQFGVDGTVLVRWFNRDGGDEAYQGRAQAGFTDDGGSVTDLSTATITLTGTGKRETIANPAETAEEPPAGS
ncbi:phage tail tube protein [Brachybacterium sp. NPDC056505]|uniref:phage tail tube protein n=1 Tax=Brachybacterium sp. NPDC056505 TaxID=3345843 RepID=UPI0036728751